MARMETPGIYSDFNNIDGQGRVRLTNGSFEDLERQNIELHDGLEVLLDDNSDFIIKGVLEFSKEEKAWVAKFNWEDFKNSR